MWCDAWKSCVGFFFVNDDVLLIDFLEEIDLIECFFFKLENCGIIIFFVINIEFRIEDYFMDNLGC